MSHWKYGLPLLLVAVLAGTNCPLFAQDSSHKKQSLDSILLRQKGIFGHLAGNLVTERPKEPNPVLRNDIPFQPYKDKVIRHIKVQTLQFGVPINDTTKRQTKGLKRLARKLHSDTKEFVIRNNLFFKEGEKLSPYLLGDNERHFRDLPILLDARIKVVPVGKDTDSVDVLILTKDVLSIGGDFRMHNSKSLTMALSEDNFAGWGDEIQLRGLFDLDRSQKLGYGFEYIKRNVGGSFLNATFGYSTFGKSFSSNKREETIAYLRLTRPLVNRFMKWTYGAELELHTTNNFYNSDSLYRQDFKYKYNIVDAWGTWNIDADKPDGSDNKARLRRLIGLRVLQQEFGARPLKFVNQYDYSFTDLKAVLADISVFRQTFYNTQYMYGFGRNEDVPEGMDASFTSGWTKKDGRDRPYAGINFNRYYFTTSRDYLNIYLGSGGYIYKSKLEDVDMVARLDYFTRLYYLKRKWRRRIFLSTSVTRQINNLLSEPLRLESDFGLQEIKNNFQGGNFRVTGKTETVFYSPWSVLYFRFAPFIFANAALMNLKTENGYDDKLFSSVGGGIRIRNESLIFGTIEFRGMYFPRPDFYNRIWHFEAKANIRFKYNQEFIKRPGFVRVN